MCFCTWVPSRYTKDYNKTRKTLLQWYCNVELPWFFLGNIGWTFVLSSCSVCSNLSSLTYMQCLFFKINSISCASVLGSLHRIQRTTTKLIQKQKTSLSKSWQIEKLVRYLFHVKKHLLFLCPFLSEHIFISPAIFNWKWKFVWKFIFIKLSELSHMWKKNFPTNSIAA